MKKGQRERENLPKQKMMDRKHELDTCSAVTLDEKTNKQTNKQTNMQNVYPRYFSPLQLPHHQISPTSN
jgi:hypothetical protein